MRKNLLLFLMILIFLSNTMAESNQIAIAGTKLKLLSNTDQCLSDCEAWVEWDLRLSPTTILTPTNSNLQFNFETLQKTGKEELLEFGVEIWEEKTTLVDDYCWKEIIIGKDLNGDNKTEAIKEKCGSHQKKEWIMISNKFYAFNFKQQVYRLRIWGKRKASIGRIGIDWIPTFFGTKIKEWAWWNSDWDSKYPVNNLLITENRLAGDLIELRNLDFSSMGFSCLDLNDLAIVEEATGTELARATEGTSVSTDGNISFKLETPLTPDTYNGKYYIYLNNATCPLPEKLLLDDLINLNAWHITNSAGGTASVDIDDRNISNSIKLTNEGENNSQSIQIVSDTNFTDVNLGFMMKGSYLNTKYAGILLGSLPATYGETGGPNFTFCGAVCFPISPNTWYYVIFERKSSFVANCYGYALDGTLLGTTINRDCSAYGYWFNSSWLGIEMLDRVATPTETFLLNRIQQGVKRYIGTLVPAFELGPKETGAINIIDINVTKIANYSVFETLPYISSKDGNVLIDFNVFNLFNNRLLADINYSTIDANGTGAVLYKDLNLTQIYCFDQDWNDIPSDCNVSWDVSIPPDENYFIIIRIFDGTILDNNVSNNPIGIDNTAPIIDDWYLITDLNTTETSLDFWIKLSDSGVGSKGSWYGLYINGSLDSNGFSDINADGFAIKTVSLSYLQTGYLIWYSATDNLDNNSSTITVSGIYTCTYVPPPPPNPIQRYFAQGDLRVKDSQRFINQSDDRANQLTDSNRFLSFDDTRQKMLIELIEEEKIVNPIGLYLTFAIIILAIFIIFGFLKRR